MRTFAYDYANDKTALVFPTLAHQDNSRDYEILDSKGKVIEAYYNGENTADQGRMHGAFYPIEPTDYKLRNSIGFGYPDAVIIKRTIGVPITQKLTWGMVAAYEKATNTIYLSIEETNSIGGETPNLAELAKDPAAFAAWQKKGRQETIAYIKQRVKERDQKTAATASNSATEALKTASVNNSEFNAYAYYSKYADLQSAIGADPQKLYNHWITSGKAEGRVAK